ncbi:MAG TPA: hypothetical protein PLW92_03750 [Chitinophagales bacterium]|nr:hypothetical protein [Chitinophagales bacterium]
MSNKALVLENGFVIDIPEELIRYLDRNKIKWEWYDMREKFWQENREETFKFFAGLPEGQELYCHTVFDGYQQLELMIQLLYKLRNKKFTFKIMQGCLCDNLLKFLAEEESSITPKELEKRLEDDDLSNKDCDEIYERIYAFKKEMNKKFEEVLSSHNIFWLKSFGQEIPLRSIDDLHKNKYDF